MKEKQIIFRIDENLKKQFQIKIRDEGLTMSEVLSSLIQKYIDCDDKLKIKQEKYKFSYISQNIVHIYMILIISLWRSLDFTKICTSVS